MDIFNFKQFTIFIGVKDLHMDKFNDVFLSKVNKKDCNFLLKMYNNKKNMKYISNGKYKWTLKEILNKIEKYSDSENSFGLYIIRLPNGIPIGEAGIFKFEDYDDYAELGYIIDENFWGMGYGEIVCRKLIDCTFKNLAVKNIITRMYQQNIASVKISRKVGMKLIRKDEIENSIFRLTYILSKSDT